MKLKSVSVFIGVGCAGLLVALPASQVLGQSPNADVKSGVVLHTNSPAGQDVAGVPGQPAQSNVVSKPPSQALSKTEPQPPFDQFLLQKRRQVVNAEQTARTNKPSGSTRTPVNTARTGASPEAGNLTQDGDGTSVPRHIPPSVLKRYDSNTNKVLDPEEWRQFREDMAKRRAAKEQQRAATNAASRNSASSTALTGEGNSQ
jgi:hypothetical protein